MGLLRSESRASGFRRKAVREDRDGAARHQNCFRAVLREIETVLLAGSNGVGRK